MHKGCYPVPQVRRTSVAPQRPRSLSLIMTRAEGTNPRPDCIKPRSAPTGRGLFAESPLLSQPDRVSRILTIHHLTGLVYQQKP